jgi:hypothetical protein
MSVLLAALASELTDVTGQTDLAIISPLLFRHITGLERTIGFFANPLVMRISSAGAPSFPELVQRTHDAVTSAYDHGEFDVLALERRLFRISFNYQYVERARANQSGSASLPGVAVQPAPMDLTAMAHGFDLMFVISAYPDRVNVELRYNLELFTAATATRLLHAYLARVARAVSG